MLGQRQAGAGQPLRHLLGGNTEAAVGMFGAQLVKLMGREVDDQQASARFQNARRLGQRPRRIFKKMPRAGSSCARSMCARRLSSRPWCD